MILLHDAFGKCESKSSATFFGGIAGSEDMFEHAARDAAPCVGDIYNDVITRLFKRDGYESFTGYCIGGVFDKILNHPCEDGWT